LLGKESGADIVLKLFELQFPATLWSNTAAESFFLHESYIL